MTDFNKHLQDWHKALESEFQATEAEDPQAILDLMRKRLLANVLELADNLVTLARVSESDSVRLAATKHAIALALPQSTTQTPSDDTLDQLIHQLTSDDS